MLLVLLQRGQALQVQQQQQQGLVSPSLLLLQQLVLVLQERRCRVQQRSGSRSACWVGSQPLLLSGRCCCLLLQLQLAEPATKRAAGMVVVGGEGRVL